MNPELKQLLEKFWTGNFSSEELEHLRALLSEASPEIQNSLRDEFNRLPSEEQLLLTAHETSDLLDHIHAKIRDRSNNILSAKKKIPTVILPLIRWSAVAAAVVIVSIILFKFSGKQPSTITGENMPAIVEKYEIVSINNDKNISDTIFLSDHSEVVLYPNSRISFVKNFEREKRNIELSGKATFTVAKDKERPFSVFANGIRTTALGTVFTVESHRNMTNVQVTLTEGNVVVGFIDSSVHKDIYLDPGQACVFNTDTKEMVVKNLKEKIIRKKNSPSILAIKEPETQLKFYREPLENIFKQLDKQFAIAIHYDPLVIKHLSFTGDFASSDSLPMILGIICRTNDLIPIFQDSLVVIKK